MLSATDLALQDNLERLIKIKNLLLMNVGRVKLDHARPDDTNYVVLPQWQYDTILDFIKEVLS